MTPQKSQSASSQGDNNQGTDNQGIGDEADNAGNDSASKNSASKNSANKDTANNTANNNNTVVPQSAKEGAPIQEAEKKLRAQNKEISLLRKQNSTQSSQIEDLSARNQKLDNTLREAREQVVGLREDLDKLSQPPTEYATVLEINSDSTVDVLSRGRKLCVTANHEAIGQLWRGQEVLLNESLNIVAAKDSETTGEIVKLLEMLTDGRAMVEGRADDVRVVELSERLKDSSFHAGDTLLIDHYSGLAVERLPRPEVEDLLLVEVPDVSYSDIGGLEEQIEMIVDALELPFLHPDLFAEHKLQASKGVLLYGPPGCGKTLIAKAVANSLASKMADSTDTTKSSSYFFNIKGPELLNKYVGETERRLRQIFQRAREKSEEGWPVVIFFDEMESLFRTRGSGISSDVEATVVPQLLAEIDGVESLKNVIVIGASNREELVDPAILRPGRFDLKIKINRPDKDAAKAIFSKYLTPDLPLATGTTGTGDAEQGVGSANDGKVTAGAAKAEQGTSGSRVKKGTADTSKQGQQVSSGDLVAELISAALEAMYAEITETEFLEVTYRSGDKEVMHFKDFASGAMIESIVRRAKQLAIKRYLKGGPKGITTQDMVAAVSQEFSEHEDLPNTTNPDDWAKISGKKGEPIVYVRTLMSQDSVSGESASGGRSLDTLNGPGQYL